MLRTCDSTVRSDKTSRAAISRFGQRVGEQGGDLAFPAGQRVRAIAIGGEPHRQLPGRGHRAGHVQPGREVQGVFGQDRGLGPFGLAAVCRRAGG
jgi:hypothetical protein